MPSSDLIRYGNCHAYPLAIKGERLTSERFIFMPSAASVRMQQKVWLYRESYLKSIRKKKLVKFVHDFMTSPKSNGGSEIWASIAQPLQRQRYGSCASQRCAEVARFLCVAHHIDLFGKAFESFGEGVRRDGAGGENHRVSR